MTRLRIQGAVGLAVALVMAFSVQATPQIGAAAPDFTGTNSYGELVRLSDLAGQKVVLEWTNHDCPFVGKHYDSGNMQALQQELTEDGVVWLTIISSAPGKQGYVTPEAANGLTHTRSAHPTFVLLDLGGEIGHLYGARTTPQMFLILEDQTLAYMGAIDSIRSANPADIPRATNYLRTAYTEILAGEPVSHPDTSPYGCSVKYAD